MATLHGGHTLCLLMAKGRQKKKRQNVLLRGSSFGVMHSPCQPQADELCHPAPNPYFITPHIATPLLFFLQPSRLCYLHPFSSFVIIHPRPCLSLLTEYSKHHNNSTLTHSHTHTVTQNVQPRVRPRFKDTPSIQQPPSPPSSLQERPLHTDTPGRFRGRLS